MSFWRGGFFNSELSNKTSIFGLRLWVVIGICVGAAIVLVLVLLTLCLACRRRRTLSSSPRKKPQKSLKIHLQDPSPPVSKDIPEIRHHQSATADTAAAGDVRIDIGSADHHKHNSHPRYPLAPPSSSTTGTASGDTSGTPSSNVGGGGPPEVSHLGWGHWYTLRELEEATGGLAEENVIGEGGYGIVYRGVLADNTTVAVKNLLNNRGQAEREFKVEVEAIGRAGHKNLVRLLGYCAEGAYRMLVYEYVDNGNLEQWLHGDVGEVSPLTWDIRMNIILGTAKGLAYLHEGLEPKVVHRDVKASNILLDQHWNPKVSDFGLAKLLCSERSYVTTRVNLVDWLKTMVGDRKSEEVVDPRMLMKPSPKAFKRALLVAIRCVDPDAHKRPKMGHVIHMLEMDDLLVREECKPDRDSSASHSSGGYNPREEGSLSRHDHRTRWY
ncbi:serine threonine-protein kinase [Musa troglodytarum]|uniref:non-specific serine/threonine protein kinase n=1 Tax=Musa troglodytarum TaxID=320322 RepID=A0A9E7HAE8_9LILI|nr:serine threonine-protein kinase [Musa troglodytarum]URE26568.1 serine threonine-protein kinase [Musa troglodytarum]